MVATPEISVNPATGVCVPALLGPDSARYRLMAEEVVRERRRHLPGTWRIEVTHGRAPYLLCRPVDAETGAALAWEGDYCLTFTSRTQARAWMTAHMPRYREVD
jgi:hypothetical protein